jgi:hypothetical protein
MAQHLSGTGSSVDIVFLTLQSLVVIFLLFHDWIPLGRLNNLNAIRSQDSFGRRVFVTLLPGLPAGVCLWLTVKHFGQPYTMPTEMWLWITYGILFAGVLRAWWIPYLLVPDAARAARYQTIFADTHTFLPRRNGIAPDTLHTAFHACLMATLVVLCIRDRLIG